MKRNSVLKQIPLLLLMLLSLSLTACTKEDWTFNIDSGKFILLDEPYKHCSLNRTIRAEIHVKENEGHGHVLNITGLIPLWAKKGDTIAIKAKLQEVYPRDEMVLAFCPNPTLYTIKYISKE